MFSKSLFSSEKFLSFFPIIELMHLASVRSWHVNPYKFLPMVRLNSPFFHGSGKRPEWKICMAVTGTVSEFLKNPYKYGWDPVRNWHFSRIDLVFFTCNTSSLVTGGISFSISGSVDLTLSKGWWNGNNDLSTLVFSSSDKRYLFVLPAFPFTRL